MFIHLDTAQVIFDGHVLANIIFVIIIRPHCLHTVHKMRPVATDVLHSVFYVSVCWSHGCAVLKGSTDQDAVWGLTLVVKGTMYLMLRVEVQPPQKGAVFFWGGGLSGLLQNVGSLYCDVGSKSDHSVLSNGITA